MWGCPGWGRASHTTSSHQKSSHPPAQLSACPRSKAPSSSCVKQVSINRNRRSCAMARGLLSALPSTWVCPCSQRNVLKPEFIGQTSRIKIYLVQVYTVTLVMKSGNFSFPCAAVSVPHAFSITQHVKRAERTGRDGGGLQDKDPCSHSGQENTQDFILIFP